MENNKRGLELSSVLRNVYSTAAIKNDSYLNICNGVPLRCMYEKGKEHGI